MSCASLCSVRLQEGICATRCHPDPRGAGGGPQGDRGGEQRGRKGAVATLGVPPLSMGDPRLCLPPRCPQGSPLRATLGWRPLSPSWAPAATLAPARSNSPRYLSFVNDANLTWIKTGSLLALSLFLIFFYPPINSFVASISKLIRQALRARSGAPGLGEGLVPNQPQGERLQGGAQSGVPPAPSRPPRGKPPPGGGSDSPGPGEGRGQPVPPGTPTGLPQRYRAFGLKICSDFSLFALMSHSF